MVIIRPYNMRYKKMLWDGLKEVTAISKKWGLTKLELNEFLVYVKALYNSGANDLDETQQIDKEAIIKRTAVAVQ